jgi:hypothetical protein
MVFNSTQTKSLGYFSLQKVSKSIGNDYFIIFCHLQCNLFSHQIQSLPLEMMLYWNITIFKGYCNQVGNHSGSGTLWSSFFHQFFILQSTYFTILFGVEFAYYNILIYIKYYIITNSSHCCTRLHQHYICKVHQWNTNLIIYLTTSISK